MENKDIHKGLDKSEVRDVIAEGFVRTYDREASVYTYAGGTPLEQAKERVRIAQQNYEAIKEQEAFTTIMKLLGWEEHDVSDETTKDPNSRFWLSFIGTQEEYNHFIKNLDIKNSEDE